MGTSDKGSSLVFVEADQLRDAFQPVGLYTIAGDKVTIKLNLMRNDEHLVTQTVEGAVNDEQSKAALIQKLTAVIIAETKKHIINPNQ